MAIFSGNINDLFDKALGIYTAVPIFFLGDSKPEQKPIPTKEVIANSGVYLFDRFGFQISEAGLSFKTLDGEEKGTGGAEIWFLPEATVVSCSRQKNIIQTVIAGHDGTVKELIGMGDWEVTFKGFLINHMPKSNNPLSVSKQTHRYPREAKKQMEQVFAVNQSMRVYSRILNDLNIHRIVTTELNFPALEGYDNVQPYELKCLSDEDIVLNLSA